MEWEDPLEEEMATHAVLCLKNPIDRGAWWATAHGVLSQTPEGQSTHVQSVNLPVLVAYVSGVISHSSFLSVPEKHLFLLD